MELKDKSIIKSFKHAIDGIKYVIKSERNFRIHIVFMLIVLAGAYIFKISKLELIICLILIGLVMAFELINTALERTVDLISLKYSDLGKFAKDTAAGSVLVMALVSLIVGLVIFVPKILEFIGR